MRMTGRVMTGGALALVMAGSAGAATFGPATGAIARRSGAGDVDNVPDGLRLDRSGGASAGSEADRAGLILLDRGPI